MERKEVGIYEGREKDLLWKLVLGRQISLKTLRELGLQLDIKDNFDLFEKSGQNTELYQLLCIDHLIDSGQLTLQFMVDNLERFRGPEKTFGRAKLTDREKAFLRQIDVIEKGGWLGDVSVPTADIRAKIKVICKGQED